MIMTRRIIFIVSVVFFFVNRATSGSNSSSPYIPLENVDVDRDYLNYCMQELTTAFPKQETTFDYLLYAFLNLNEADFVKNNTYTKEAYEYFHDLLNTAHDISYPELLNPQGYCINEYEDKVGDCIRSIAEMGCAPDVVGVICVKILYLGWKKENPLIPIRGTENLSDEDLVNAMSRIADKFPGLSGKDLFRRLLNKYLLEDFYSKNENRRKNINHMKDILNLYLIDARDMTKENKFNQGVAEENYRNADKWYTAQREKDIEDARFECYGIREVYYEDVVLEYNRRQKLYSESYATYLYNQLKHYGQKLGSKDKKKFNNPENFCIFLSENPDYYNYLYN